MATNTPIACTLTPSALWDRVAWVKKLNEASLRSYHQQGLTLDLTYGPEGLEGVRELVRRERECCAFLQFAVDEGPGFVRLRIEAPPDAGKAAGLLLAPFLAGARVGKEANTAETHANGRVTGMAAATSAGLAVVCGVCCVLPFAFPIVAMTGLGSVIAFFAGMFPWARGLAVLLVSAGWLWLAWRSLRMRRWPAASTLSAMVVATALLGLTMGWPVVERHIVSVLKGGG